MISDSEFGTNSKMKKSFEQENREKRMINRIQQILGYNKNSFKDLMTNDLIEKAKERIKPWKKWYIDNNIPVPEFKFRYVGCNFVQINYGNNIPYLMYIKD